ncbi:hypothetical protein GUITHDRAFT_149523 [Guillardia theta CCMP2712]|uniref:Adenylate kinase n=1 Tax=Guillardia theta (strain CCMP2712) TaxID=905079 RepID=L1I4N5_GUITC|nr:hypothetical protein GUITHDRAFT_149523 [Guillardia theta CCMP2712]EKX31057.1 hypothetical protein GUITHDRAFT_149523 [Guillardia theta CCMP2712]|eukprot:XP_005818037.1 hypothetical protein GUITHDRAFT_149523 [Guillardia theta CCMP2712]
MGCGSSKAAHAEAPQVKSGDEPEEVKDAEEPQVKSSDQAEEVKEQHKGGEQRIASPVNESPAVEEKVYVQAAIYGPPGSNKSNLCEQLAASIAQGGLGLRHFTMGEIQRMAIRGNTELGPKVKQAMAEKFKKDKDAKDKSFKGQPSGPSDELNAQKPENGWILDGYPTTMEQVKSLKEQGIDIQQAVIVVTPDAELVRLMTGRRMDLEESKIYHLEGIGGYEKPPEEVRQMSIPCIVTVDSWVDQIKDRLVQRKDDQEEKVLEKLNEYHAVFDQVENLFPQVFKVLQSQKTVSQKVYEETSEDKCGEELREAKDGKSGKDAKSNGNNHEKKVEIRSEGGDEAQNKKDPTRGEEDNNPV